MSWINSVIKIYFHYMILKFVKVESKIQKDFPGGSDGKESACNAGGARDAGSVPGLWRPPREGNATHPSILAWKTPRTEEPGGLQSMGSQRVRHDWATITFTKCKSIFDISK